MLAAAAGSVDRPQDALGVGPPLVGEHLPHLLPADGRNVVAQRGQASLKVSGLVLVESRELDRGQDLARLHRRAAHRRELIDQGVDRRHQTIAAPPPLVLLAAAPVDAIACPANRPARGDSPEAQGACRPPAGWISLLTIGHVLGWRSFSSETGGCRSLVSSLAGLISPICGRASNGSCEPCRAQVRVLPCRSISSDLATRRSRVSSRLASSIHRAYSLRCV